MLAHADVVLERFGYSEKYTLIVRGDIREVDVENFQNALDTIDKNKYKLHLNMVQLDSVGGGRSSGMDIGRIIRKNRLNTYIAPKSLCNSACVYAFIGGVQRYGFGKIGVHSTTFVDDFQIDDRYVADIVDKDIERVTNYVKEQRIDGNLASSILSTPFWSVRYLTDSEKFNWTVNGTDRAESEILVTNIANERKLKRSEVAKIIQTNYFECFNHVRYLQETVWDCLKSQKVNDDWFAVIKRKLTPY